MADDTEASSSSSVSASDGAVFQSSIQILNNINIVKNGVRNLHQSVEKSPGLFGSPQRAIRLNITELTTTLTITERMLNEDRLNSESRHELIAISDRCQLILMRLNQLADIFEKWDLRELKRDEVNDLVDSLVIELQRLEGINGIRRSTSRLEKNIQRYISTIQQGYPLSNTTAPSVSQTTNGNEQEWENIQRELEGAGITTEQLETSQDRVLTLLKGGLDSELTGEFPSVLDSSGKKTVLSDQLIPRDTRKTGPLRKLVHSIRDENYRMVDATKRGDLEQVQQALEQGADVNSLYKFYPKRYEPKCSPLTFAVRKANVDLIDLLLKYRADPNQSLFYEPSNMIGPTKPIQFACTLCTHSSWGKKPKSMPSKETRRKITETLLQSGADPNCGTAPVIWPLHRAIERDGNEDIVELLLKHGVSPNAPDRLSEIFSPMWHALRYMLEPPRINSAKLLLKYGARTSVQTDFGPWSVNNIEGPTLEANEQSTDEEKFLAYAVYHRLDESIPFLLERGASPNMSYSNGMSLLHMVAALRNSHSKMYEVTYLNIWVLLVQLGADPLIQDRKGRTATEFWALLHDDDPPPVTGHWNAWRDR